MTDKLTGHLILSDEISDEEYKIFSEKWGKFVGATLDWRTISVIPQLNDKIDYQAYNDYRWMPGNVNGDSDR